MCLLGFLKKNNTERSEPTCDGKSHKHREGAQIYCRHLFLNNSASVPDKNRAEQNNNRNIYFSVPRQGLADRFAAARWISQAEQQQRRAYQRA
jgi:hypothetical protein